MGIAHVAMQDRICKELENQGWITTKEKKVQNVGKVDIYAQKKGKVLIVECGTINICKWFLKKEEYEIVWQPYLFFFDKRKKGPKLEVEY